MRTQYVCPDPAGLRDCGFVGNRDEIFEHLQDEHGIDRDDAEGGAYFTDDLEEA